MILICVNELAGPTGYHKSVVETANALHRAGHPVAILSFLGRTADGGAESLPRWPLDVDVPAFTLQTLASDGGRLLHKNIHPVLSGMLAATHFQFTENQLAVIRQINAALTEEDTVIFTAPIPAYAFHHALQGETRRATTVLQIHNDYHFHDGLWRMLMDSRDVIDRLQTVSSGLRPQFIPTFDDEHVVFVPNFPGASTPVERIPHQGVNIALPASFQHRKNQLDAVRALALIADESVHLTLWGSVSRLNPYLIAVQQLVEQLGLEERVHFPGFGSEAEIYGTADIVVMTSLSEGFGYPLIEAAFHRLPAVAYDFEFGPRDAIDEGTTGYIVPPGDVTQLADRLRALASDAAMRARFGDAARTVFDERFATDAVVAQYRAFIGSSFRAVDLMETLATDGVEPIGIDALSYRTFRSKGHRIGQITVESPMPPHDVRLDNGTRVVTPDVVRLGEATIIEFRLDGADVVSYVTEPGSADRHYLANLTADHEFEVRPYLRRDAEYGAGMPPVDDTIFAVSGGAKHADIREVANVLGSFAKNAPRDVAWKLRQLAAASRNGSSAKPTAVTAGAAPAAAATDAPTERPSQARTLAARWGGLTRSLGLPQGTSLNSVSRLALSGGKRAMELVVLRLAVNASAPTRREIPRHPRFPVVSGIDNFGAPINQVGGVAVRNTGTPSRPTVRVDGEYDFVLLRDATGTRRIEPPFSYGEMFTRICAAEREHGLFDITTADGDYVWELGRSALIIQLAEASGLWGKNATAGGATVDDSYSGPKRLTSAPRARRVVFDYARRGQSGYRTAAYRDDETMFVVQPEVEGYPEVTDTNLVYPFHEFNQWKEGWRRRWAHLRVPEIDARPFENALSDALGIHVDLGDHLRNRLAKFLAEREFWTPVFERIQPEEVMIASSHWWAGIAAAAERSGATVSDIQYALTSHYAPSFWFGAKPHYGATRFYAWSDYWAERANVYQEHVIVPRQQPEFAAAECGASAETSWDVCVISQPRVLRRILAFAQQLVRERPDLKVVLAPHPAQRAIIPTELANAGLTDKVTIAAEDTLTTIGKSAMCVGTFSTSLWEAAALGRPTYVIPVPGYEETLQDVESGLFRLATSPHDLVPYDLPESRHTIFGHGA